MAWLVLEQQDAAGLVTFDSQIRTLLRPASNTSHLKQMIQVMETATPGKKTAAGPIFHELAERLKKRGVVMIFSDFFDNVNSLLAGLKHFHHRRHDVVLLHVLDPAELDFPFQRPTQFQGLEEFPAVMTDPQSLRRAYLKELGIFQQKLREGCRTMNMDYELMRTDRPLDAALRSFLAGRMARMK